MHLKRLTTPKSWSINRKEYVFTTRPNPRGTLENTIPLVILIRDMLELAKTAKEVQTILNDRKVKINGKVKLSKNFPVTLFDIIEIEGVNTYQLTFTLKGKLAVEEVSQDFRFARIENKTMLRGKKLQLNLFDGSNLLVDKDDYKVGDVIQVSLKDNKIKSKLELKTGAEAFIIKGRHRGKRGKVNELLKTLKPNEVTLTADKEELRTRLDNIYVVG